MPKVKVGDITMYYKLYGEGEPLVLIQGLTMDNSGWALQTHEFAKKYKVIVFDNRGVGRTDAPEAPCSTRIMADDTAHLMDELGIEKAHILGISLGGMIGQEFAIKYPQRVRSLILAASAACPSKGSCRSAHIISTLLAMARNGISLEMRTRMFMAWGFTENFFSVPEQVEMTVNMMKSHPYPQSTKGLALQVAASMRHDTRNRLEKIKAPTLVLVGSEDYLLPVHLSKELADAIPNAQLVVVEKAGHFFCFEFPEAFNQSVLNFLEKVG